VGGRASANSRRSLRKTRSSRVRADPGGTNLFGPSLYESAHQRDIPIDPNEQTVAAGSALVTRGSQKDRLMILASHRIEVFLSRFTRILPLGEAGGAVRRVERQSRRKKRGDRARVRFIFDCEAGADLVPGRRWSQAGGALRSPWKCVSVEHVFPLPR